MFPIQMHNNGWPVYLVTALVILESLSLLWKIDLVVKLMQMLSCVYMEGAIPAKHD